MPDMSPRLPLTLKDAILESSWDEASSAVEGVDGRAMTYGELKAHMRRTVAMLNGAGYRRGDRFATVMNNGPEEFAALVALMSGFTVVPLNPAYKKEELAGYMKAAAVKAAVVEDPACPAADVARELGLEVYELVKEGARGTLGFSLRGKALDPFAEAEPEFATEDDLIAVFGTSGTTGRPKLVPLKQSNILWAQHFYQKNLRDSPSDRCLAFLPIFYAHGLISPLRTLFYGGCVIYAPSFDPLMFFRWLESSRATWMTAGPAAYQAILERAGENAEIIARNRLKHISTGNAAMPGAVMDRLEKTFGVPVLETYAMTEAAIITTNPAPPGKAKRGSAGVSWGGEVAIMGEDGSLLPVGEMGEVVVRGKVVMGGYENNPEANASAFRNGWFRTGDLGLFDSEGYLFIKGRIKDLINRGGEKIIPQQVEDVLLTHPAVKEAVVFPVKHQRLGEDIAAAVVLKEGAKASDVELKIHASKKLAFYKVPSRVIMVGELPKGATGKVGRATIAEKLGLTEATWEKAEYVPPQTETERKLAGLLEKVFPGVQVGAKDNFFDLGGYSLMAIRIFKEIDAEFGVRLPLSTLFQYPTVGEMAAFLESKPKQGWKRIVPLQANGSGSPLFLIHGGDGDILNYKELVKALGDGRRIYGVQARGLDGREAPNEGVEAMAREYLEEIARVQPDGPYYLMGFSAGGVISFELARQLERRGKRVAYVGIIDMDPPETGSSTMRRNTRRNFFRQLYFFLKDLMPNSPKRRAGMDLKLGKRATIIAESGLGSLGIKVGDYTGIIAADAVVLPEARKKVWLAQARAVLGYKLGAFGGKVTVFKGEGIPFIYPPVGERGWERYAKGGAEVFVVPGRIHGSQLRRPNVEYLAALANMTMRKADRPS